MPYLPENSTNTYGVLTAKKDDSLGMTSLKSWSSLPAQAVSITVEKVPGTDWHYHQHLELNHFVHLLVVLIMSFWKLNYIIMTSSMNIIHSDELSFSSLSMSFIFCGHHHITSIWLNHLFKTYQFVEISDLFCLKILFGRDNSGTKKPEILFPDLNWWNSIKKNNLAVY